MLRSYKPIDFFSLSHVSKTLVLKYCFTLPSFDIIGVVDISIFNNLL